MVIFIDMINMLWGNKTFCTGKAGLQGLKSEMEEFGLDRVGKRVTQVSEQIRVIKIVIVQEN